MVRPLVEMAPVNTSGLDLPRSDQTPSLISDSYLVKPKEADLEGQANDGILAGDQSDSEEGDGVGRQIQLEAGNSIKYRTCSWQKVCS